MQIRLNMEVTSKNYMDCLDVLLYSVAKWLGKDCRMQYLEAWGFRYDDEKLKLISEKIGCGRGNEFEHLEKYHGISIKHYKHSKFNFLKFLNEELNHQKMPILMQIDCYWAKWMKDFYQNKHIETHYILVLGYDDQKNQVLIVDSQDAQCGIWCPYEEMENAFQNGYYIRNVKEEEKFIDPKEAIKMMLGRLKPYDYLGINRLNMEARMEKFLLDMKKNFDLSLEVEPYLDNITESKLLNAINDIGKGRIKAAFSLEYIKEHSGMEELQGVINYLLDISASWKQAFGVFVKYCYMRDNDKIRKNLVNKLFEIKDKECTAIDLLEKCYKGTINEKFENTVHKKLGKKLEGIVNFDLKTIDIDKYFNNAGCFSEVTSEAIAELSNPHRYLLCKGYEGTEFKNSHMAKDENDNIICEGQLIDLETEIGENSYLMLLMCSEFTNCEVEISLLFGDGDSEKIQIGVTSWLYPEPEYNDFVAIEGIPVRIEIGEKPSAFCYKFPGHIYGSIYQIDKKNTTVTGILLPDSINVHIFGITIINKNNRV